MNVIKLFKKQTVRLKALSYIILFVVLYGVCSTEIYYAGLTPFGVGIVFALFWIKYNGYSLSATYMFSYSLAGMSFLSVLESLGVVITLCVMEYLRQKKLLKLSKFRIFLFAFLSQIIFIICNIGDVKENLALFVSIVLGLMFLYSCLCFFDATFNRGMMVKLNLDEKICGSVILVIFILGLAGVNISVINMGLIFVPLIILISTYLTTTNIVLVVSALMGMGFSVFYLNPIYISLFIVLALSSIAFKCNFKYLSMVAIILSFVVFSMLFNIGIFYGDVISIIVGSIIFAFLPQKILLEVSNRFTAKTQVVIKNIINQTKKQIVARLGELSLIFDKMNHVYKDMARGVLADDKAIELIKNELISNICGNCAEKDNCYRRDGSFVESSIDSIVATGYEKGKILLLDLPQYLTSNCGNVNQIVSFLNNILSSYKDYKDTINNLDTSRILIADQLCGVSQMLNMLSTEINVNIRFDTKFETLIKEELSYKNIVCLECALYEKDVYTKYVNLVVKTDTINKKIIEKIVSKITSTKLKIVNIEPSEIANASIVSMVTKPNYDIAFGSATMTKRVKRCVGIITHL